HARTFFQAIMSQVIDLTGGDVGKPQGQVHLSIDCARLAWPMSWPDDGKEAGLCFDHRAEGVVAQGSLLL
ncbi:hypothetical protein VDR63_22330, partial [Xanthomonas campestris pv. campestris]|nr:hypothetical protein [Xanthomonas campestris pv. campestris]